MFVNKIILSFSIKSGYNDKDMNYFENYLSSGLKKNS